MSDQKAVDDVVHIEVDGSTNLSEDQLAAERHIRLKTDLYLVPMLCLLLIVAFLDRTNIGNARIEGLTADLKMKGSDYNVALFIFFIPYILLDIPSNILMKRLRPSIYLSSLMLCWGVVTIGEGVTRSYAGLVVCRVLLGCLEAGFFPGAIYLLAMYYTRYELHTRITIYYSSALLSTAFGGLLAYAIGHMGGVGGYSAWRWIFILEGLLTIIVALFSFYMLPDWPHQAKYLNENERTILLRKLARDTKDYVETKSTMSVLKDCLTDPKVFFSALMYFGTAVTGSSSSYFLPTILKELGWTSLKAQYMSIPIWMAAWATSIVIGFSADALKVRWIFSVGPLCFSVVGYAILLCQRHVSVAVRYIALFFVIGGCYAAVTVSLTWLANNIVGTRRRGTSTAILLAMGNCGSVLGSNVYITGQAPLYPVGYGVSLGAIVLTQIAAVGYLLHVRYENRQKESGKRDHLLSLPMEEVNALGDKHPAYRYTY